MRIAIGILAFLTAVATIYLFGRGSDISNEQPSPAASPTLGGEMVFDFSQLSGKYRFSGVLPDGLTAQFVQPIEAINISNRIFVRFFEADDFLTLSTVNILERHQTTIHGRAAVIYEIEKKEGVADFPYQPLWRSRRHRLVDIRLSSDSPSLFYVFAYAPDFPEAAFDSFIDSLVFEAARNQ